MDMCFIISNVENKHPEKPNRYHKRFLGKRCGIEYLGSEPLPKITVEDEEC